MKIQVRRTKTGVRQYGTTKRERTAKNENEPCTTHARSNRLESLPRGGLRCFSFDVGLMKIPPAPFDCLMKMPHSSFTCDVDGGGGGGGGGGANVLSLAGGAFNVESCVRNDAFNAGETPGTVLGSSNRVEHEVRIVRPKRSPLWCEAFFPLTCFLNSLLRRSKNKTKTGSNQCILSCLALPCLVLSCLVLSCLVLSCLALPYLVLCCVVLCCVVLCCVVLCCVVLCCVVLCCLAVSCLVL